MKNKLAEKLLQKRDFLTIFRCGWHIVNEENTKKHVFILLN